MALIDRTTTRHRHRRRGRPNHLQMCKRKHPRNRRPVRLRHQQSIIPMMRHASGGVREVAVEGGGEEGDQVRMAIVDGDKNEEVVQLLGLEGLPWGDAPSKAD